MTTCYLTGDDPTSRKLRALQRQLTGYRHEQHHHYTHTLSGEPIQDAIDRTQAEINRCLAEGGQPPTTGGKP